MSLQISISELDFPVIIIKPNESPIYYFSQKNFALVSIKGERFYNGCKIYDGRGNVFEVKKILGVEKAPFVDSVRYFQPMKKVLLDIRFVQNVSLDKFKDEIKIHFKNHSRYWSMRDSIIDIEKRIDKMTTYRDLIEFLK
ncbi:MAG: hypothetical protein QM781_13105 [Chitinophagaceae bacterium]